MTEPIRRVRVYEVALPLRTPFTISGGSLAVRRSLIVELEDASGACGYGESAPFELPFYSDETLSSAFACLRDVLIPRVLGRRVEDSTAMWTLLGDGVQGNRMARAGLDTAWWDLAARQRQVSLADLVTERLTALGVSEAGARRAEMFSCGVAIGIPEHLSRASLEGEVRDAVRRGYCRVKLKVRPGWDHEPVRAAQAVLQAEGAALPLWVDANGAYDLRRDREALAALDDMGLLFIEQPFPETALGDAVRYDTTGRTPVCLDESLVSDDVARQVLEIGGPMIWNLKVQRMGGLEEACRVYATGAAAGVKLWVGTMPETGVGAQSAMALAVQGACVYPSDVEPSERWYEPGTDLLELTMSDAGLMAVPTGPPPAPPLERMTLVLELTNG
ncbi:MAG: enolase C-terminal domain-like protein [Dehalococcoidia bacterium]